MTDVGDRIAAVFADAGATGWLHAVAVDGSSTGEVNVDGDRPVALASVYKLPLLVAMMRMVDGGRLDLTERVTLRPTDRTAGPSGISALLDDVTMSWRDLAAMMMSVSDNAAADAILQRVGVDEVADALSALGLTRSRILGGTADAYRLLHVDTGTTNLAAALDALADADRPPDPRAYDPLQSSSATAREMTTLLRTIWTDVAASPASCATIRRLMSLQVRSNRIASGFAFAGVSVAGKTGTMGALRHDVGVVRFDGERPYAVAVFTQSARATPIQPRIDAAIGQAARLAVDHLRGIGA
ncbi:serine hydrolase [Mycolicibacterium madagascariense]|uniref:Serine hydrolase n=1 Tax=Mycolicibacterium madagascariense TaxID=212765 RepID=A0A7I7XJM1_9MYCO|nr:serine hydrolase [Mycolicibacterium madagascariense]MCV7015916.1 serine hydrolase [Mycolicibacterium madagascariense]BBZ29391.1 serine hydrolase [Mycolicibacterium madagascariense]